MPTFKQKVAFKRVLNGSTITKAMTEANYAPTTASTTGKLTRTKGWQKLMEKYLPDKLLAKKHLEGLEATFTDKFNTEAIDYHARHKYLDSAYKLKRKYPSEGEGGDKNLIVIISGESAKRYNIPDVHTP